MKLKNIGSSIVSIGTATILPGETKEVADKVYEENAALNFLIHTNRLALEKDAAKKAPAKTAKPAKTQEAESTADTAAAVPV